MSNVKVGLQLYSIRDKMEADFEGTLKKVKEMGYDYVEFAGYFGKTAEEIRAILDKYGLECVSVHQGLDFYEEKGIEGAEYVKKLGAKYSVIPWFDKKRLYEDIENVYAEFEKMGKFLKENGLEMLYHNHDFEYVEIDGELVIDKIYSAVNPEYLNPEFDTCWVKYSGHEPVEYIEKYADRINIVHIKDFRCEKLNAGQVYGLIGGGEHKSNLEENKFEFRPVGSGMQDVKGILAAVEKAGVEYIIVEQDRWHDQDSLECAKKSREYLKSIGY